jgi:hypothetical protein
VKTGGATTISGAAATTPITCTVPKPKQCTGALVFVLVETVNKNKVTGVSASKRWTVVVGRTAYSIAGGATRHVKVSLNATGKRLRSHFKGLRVRLQADPHGAKKATTLRTVRFRGA